MPADTSLDILVRVQNLTERAFQQIAGELKGIETQAAATSRNTGSMATEFKKFGASIESSLAQTFSFKNILGTIGPMVAGAFSVQAVLGFAKGILALGGQVTDMAERFGLTTDEVQELKYAAETSGTTIEKFGVAISQMSKRLGEGDTSTVATLARLNLNLDELRAKSPADAFQAIGEAIATIPDPMQQSYVAQKLFGEAAAAVLPTIRSGIRDVRDEAHQMAQVLSKDAIKSLDEFGKKWDQTVTTSQVVGAEFFLSLEKSISSLGNIANGLWEGWMRGSMVAGFVMTGFTARINDSAKATKAAADELAKKAAAQREADGVLVQSAKNAEEASRRDKKAAEDAARAAEQLRERQDRLFGRDLIARAQQFAGDLGSIGNLSKIAEEKQDELFKVMSAGIEAAERLGQKVPKAWRDIADATRDALPATQLLTDTLGKMTVTVLPNLSRWAEEVRNRLQGLTKDGLLPVSASFAGFAGILNTVNVETVNVAGQFAETELQLLAGRDATSEWMNSLGGLSQSFTDLTGVAIPGLDLVLDKVQAMLNLIGSVLNLVSQVSSGFSGWGNVAALVGGGGAGGGGGWGNVAGLAGSAGGAGGIGVSAATLGIAGGAAAGGLTGWYVGRATGSTAKGVLAGAAAGATAGSIVPGAGTIIGAGVGALAGWLGARKANKEANEDMEALRDRLLETLGGMENLSRAAALVGVDIERLFALKGAKGVEEFNRLLGTFEEQWSALDAATKRYGITLDELEGKTPLDAMTTAVNTLLADYETLSATALGHEQTIRKMAPAFNDVVAAAASAGKDIPTALAPFLKQMAELGLLTESNQLAILGLSDQVSVDFEAMQRAAEAYGIDLGSLGEKFQQSKLSDAARQIFADFEMLRLAGADVGGVLFGMKEEISALVQQSIAFGTAIPESMRPLIEELARSGNLLDANGNKLEDLSGLQFAPPIEAQFDRLIAKLDEMIQALGAGVTGAANQAINAIDRIPRDVDIDVNWRGRSDFPTDGNFSEYPGAARGIYARGPRPVLFGEGGEPELGGPVDFMARVLAMAQQTRGAGSGDVYHVHFNIGNAFMQTPGDRRRLADLVDDVLMEKLRTRGRISSA